MPIRLLISDDHAVFRSGLKALLEREKDFQVVGEAGNGLEAMKMVSATKADILILDLNMPGVSGAKAAEEILKQRPRFPIIILTMHEDQYYLRELFRIGAKGFVLKKSTGSELVQAIRAVSGGGMYVDPALGGQAISSAVGRPLKSEKGWSGLTLREQEVCRLLAYGHTNPEVADRLGLSERTVETHRANLMGKLNFKGRAELVRFAIDQGLLNPT